MKKVKRVITALTTEHCTFRVGEDSIQSIEYRRNGYAGVYQGGDESNYCLTTRLQGVAFAYTLIPYSKITSVTYIEQEVQEEEVPKARRAED